MKEVAEAGLVSRKGYVCWPSGTACTSAASVSRASYIRRLREWIRGSIALLGGDHGPCSRC